MLKNFFFLKRLFVIILLIPNVTSVLYFCFLASPVFVSTATLTVFNPAHSSSSIVSLLSGGSSDGSAEEAYVLQDYVVSWAEFQKIVQPMNLDEEYRHGDFISRYGGASTFFTTNDISLWHYYQSHVSMKIDEKSGIFILNVEGYTPEFANKLANLLLSDSVSHLDLMNNQQESDFSSDAEMRKKALSLAVQNDERNLDAYRAMTGVYDPTVLYNSDLVLQNSLAMKAVDLEAQYESLSKAEPNNPAAQNILFAINTVKQNEAKTREQIPDIAKAANVYENLIVTRTNDEALLQQASEAVQEAELKATQNRYYLDVISSPSEPDTAELPRRLQWIGGVFIVTTILWGLLR